jgi:hypothetical protein
LSDEIEPVILVDDSIDNSAINDANRQKYFRKEALNELDNAPNDKDALKKNAQEIKGGTKLLLDRTAGANLFRWMNYLKLIFKFFKNHKIKLFWHFI